MRSEKKRPINSSYFCIPKRLQSYCEIHRTWRDEVGRRLLYKTGEITGRNCILIGQCNAKKRLLNRRGLYDLSVRPLLLVSEVLSEVSRERWWNFQTNSGILLCL